MESSAIFSSDINDVRRFASQTTYGQVSAYMLQALHAPANLVGAGYDAVLSQETITLFQGKNIPFCLSVRHYTQKTEQKPVITPFNVSEVMKSNGYNIEVVNSVPSNRTDVVQNNPSGYVRFQSLSSDFYCKIEGTFIDYSTITDERIQKVPFFLPMAQVARLIGSYTSFKAGNFIPIQSGASGTELLDLKSYGVSDLFMQLAAVGSGLVDYLVKIPCPKNTTWKNITLHGLELANYVYRALHAYGVHHKGIGNILSYLNQMIFPTANRPFFDIEENKIVTRFKAPRVPTTYHNTILSLMVKGKTKKVRDHELPLPPTVDYLQAYKALEQARVVRGHNAGQKGSMTRSAYVGVNVPSDMAEYMYFATNILDFLNHECIVVHADNFPTRVIEELMETLALEDWGGLLVIPHSNTLKQHLAPATSTHYDHLQNKYHYGASKFVVTMSYSIAHNVCGIYSSTEFRYPDDTIIIDLRHGSEVLSAGKLNQTIEDANTKFNTRVASWGAWKYPAITRMHVCPAMVGATYTKELELKSDKNQSAKTDQGEPQNVAKDVKWRIYSGCDPHNLVVWVTNSSDEPSCWRYNVNNEDEMLFYLGASILTNVCRCVGPFIGYPPYVVMDRFGYRVPELYTKMRGKVGVAGVNFDDMNLEALTTVTPQMASELFQAASDDMRQQMLTSSAFSDALQNASGVVTTSPSPVTTTTISAAAFDAAALDSMWNG